MRIDRANKWFKWEWRVVWLSGNGELYTVGLPTRRAARAYKATVPVKCKPRVQRRLVARHWREYRDTFTYNAKGCGNGR